MKKKQIQRMAALLCAATCGISWVGCNGDGTLGSSSSSSSITYASLSDVGFWGTYSTEKVLQDRVNIYEDMKGAAQISVRAIGGEEEAAQIIMTAGDKAVKEYDVRLSDLKGQGEEVFSKENIKVYHERYINVTGAAEYYTVSGYYPDCLVPFERVKAVGETGFKANNNQGLYVSFKIPENQAAGTYTGNMEIVIGGESKIIPITLRVVAGNITAETHVMSSFLNEWQFFRGELDTTEEMYESYNQMLFDYRLGCNNVIVYANKNEFHADIVDFYAETVCRYAKQIECPGYNIPWFFKNYAGSGKTLNGRELTLTNSYDVDKLMLYFRTIAYKGLEENVDPFKKAFVYGYDEPDLNLGIDKAKRAVKEWSYIVKQCKINMTEELRADDSIENQELLEQILDSLEKMPHLVLSSTYLDNDMDLSQEDIVYCPEFQHLQSDGARSTYRLSEDNDLWWYGCVNPDYPYPTYHIDDTVLSARLESWMKVDYNIQGNLYWSTCLYTEPKADKNGPVVYPEDLYSGTAARSLNTNGEGFLFYPGKKYGVDGPLPSVRLEQIRDGLEEYEILYKMGQIYASVGEGYGEEKIMRYLYDSMYSGTKINTTSEVFELNRTRLLDLFELACSKANCCITNVSEGAGAYEFEIYANTGYTVKQGGKELTQKRNVNGGFVYTLNLNVGAGETLDLSVDVDGQTLGFGMSFGSSSVNYNAQYANDNNVVQTRTQVMPVTTKLVLAQSVDSTAQAGEQWLQLSFVKADKKVAQDFLLVDDNVIKNLSVEANKFVIRLYNSSQETLSAELLMQYGKSLNTYTKYESLQLKPGMNVISINNIDGMKWHDLKYINRVRINVGKVGDEARDCLYFVDMSVYKS